MKQLLEGLKRLQALYPQIGMILGLVLSLAIASQLPGSSLPGRESAPGSENYQVPAPEIQARLDTIRQDLGTALRELRVREGSTAVTMDPIGLQVQAQRWAERTAVVGKEEPSPSNVTMLQQNLPLAEANGHAFVDRWVRSEDHTNVLIDSRYSTYGIGVAYSDGKVWVALQLSE